MPSNLNDGRAEALKALVTSLAPQDAEKMSSEQVDIVASRLDQILGNIEDAEDAYVQRNAKGEVLNEEGLPIIEISEPAGGTDSRLATEPVGEDIEVTEEPDVIPLSLLPPEERARRLQRCHKILDFFEAEEEKELALEALQEERDFQSELAKRETEAQAERDRKLAQREMQKKMGKALLRNIAEARAKEEKEKAEILATPVAGPSSRPTSPGGSRKPKKKVSFANIPDVDVDKPKLNQEKSHITLGDVSIGILKGNTKRVRLKKDELANLPMRLDVVERIPGQWKKDAPFERQHEPDSDDDSSPEDEHHRSLRANGNDTSDDDDDTWRSYGDLGEEEDGEDGLETLTQAQLQREAAIEYLERRSAITTDLQQVASSNKHGEDEWDAPEVPLEATLSNRPPKSKTSRFKASLQGPSSNGNSSGQSHLLAKAVRTGKLTSDGNLEGGVEGDSEPEDTDEIQTQRALDMLMRGEIVSEANPGSAGKPRTANGISSQRQASKFVASRTSNQDAPSSSDVDGAMSPHLLSSQPSPSPLRKPPSVMSSPKVTSARSSTIVKPSTSQPYNAFSSMIIDSPSESEPFSSVVLDSPSFPQPGDRIARATPLADKVQESAPRRTPLSTSVNMQQNTSGKVSRFKAARS